MDPTQLKLMKEKCILVNEKDEVIGMDSKENCHRLPCKLHRAFSVFFFNKNNELLLQQRSPQKITFPLYWANTCCSHPLYCEPELEENESLGVKRAAIRKLEHELGIKSGKLNTSDFRFVGKILYKAESDAEWGEWEIDHILLIKAECQLSINSNEVATTRYISLSELETFLENKPDNSISPWFKLIAQKFLPKWWKDLDIYLNGDQLTIDNQIHRLN